MKCMRCNIGPAIYSRVRRVDVVARYVDSEHLCGPCFQTHVEASASAAVDLAGISTRSRIAVGMSGGKDSQLTLTLLTMIREQRSLDWDIIALSVDEGIAGYRADGLDIASRLCKKLDVPHYTIAYSRELGFTLDDFVSEHPDDRHRACTFCTTPRVMMMAVYCRQHGYDILASGNNFDDMCADFMLALGSQAVSSMVRAFYPVHIRYPGDIRFFKPIWSLSDREIALYLMQSGIEYQSRPECPYSVHMPPDLMRAEIHRMEDTFPGYKYALRSQALSMRSAAEAAFAKTSWRTCGHCLGSVAEGTQELCVSCRVFRQMGLEGTPASIRAS